MLSYTLFQNGSNFSILLFTCKLALVAWFKGKYSFESQLQGRGNENTRTAAILE